MKTFTKTLPVVVFLLLTLSSCSLGKQDTAELASGAPSESDISQNELPAQPVDIAGISFDIPTEVKEYPCDNTVISHCYKNEGGNKNLQISQENGGLESATYTDHPAGESYSYYSQYDHWISDYVMKIDTTFHQEKIDCLDAKFGKKSAISFSLIPQAYANGPDEEFNCDTFLEDMDQYNHIRKTQTGAGAPAYVFPSGDGPAAWQTTYIENPSKTKTYKIMCMASDPFLTDENGNDITDSSWAAFIDDCTKTVLKNWKFE